MISVESHASAEDVIPLADCLELAERLDAAAHHWHHHVLFPGCVHNTFGRYAILIEDDDEHHAYFAETDRFPDVDKDLVRMLHGDDILDPLSTSAATGVAIHSPLVQHAQNLTRSGEPWHHHMCFPTCTLNPAQGRWTIVIESDSNVLADSFDDEPVQILREIEVLFFTTNNPTPMPDS